jgi:hypothetical protein
LQKNTIDMIGCIRTYRSFVKYAFAVNAHMLQKTYVSYVLIEYQMSLVV